MKAQMRREWISYKKTVAWFHTSSAYRIISSLVEGVSTGIM